MIKKTRFSIIYYFKKTRLICKAMELLDSVPQSLWRLCQAGYNIVLLSVVIFMGVTGINQRTELKRRQITIQSKQDSLTQFFNNRVTENMKAVDTFFNKIENDK